MRGNILFIEIDLKYREQKIYGTHLFIMCVKNLAAINCLDHDAQCSFLWHTICRCVYTRLLAVIHSTGSEREAFLVVLFLEMQSLQVGDIKRDHSLRFIIIRDYQPSLLIYSYD